MQEQNSAPVDQAPAEEVKSAQRSFAELRNIVNTKEKENAQLKQRLSQLEEVVSKINQKDEDDTNEPYLDHNRFRKEMDKFKESLTSDMNRLAEEKARHMLAEEKKNEYLAQNKDFYDVMQENTLNQFIKDHPNLAQGFGKLPDSFERQQVLYEAIKTINNLKTSTPQPAAPPQSPLAAAFDSRKAAMAYQPGGSSGGPFQSIGDFSQGGMKNAYEKYKALQKTVSL